MVFSTDELVKRARTPKVIFIDSTFHLNQEGDSLKNFLSYENFNSRVTCAQEQRLVLFDTMSRDFNFRVVLCIDIYKKFNSLIAFLLD